ncbi:MAG TPA: flagellar basal body P-ring protein FlgI [Pirellulales bacterium]|nr:flagellar basal body P-ring protein FlgI [Pirellulales bacterium]
MKSSKAIARGPCRRQACVWTIWAWLAAVVAAGAGCSALNVRSQSPEDPIEQISREVTLIGDISVPFGMNYIPIESVALVTGLPGTGSDPPPSPQRGAVLAEMQTRGVKDPNAVLASPTTDIVLVRGYLRPGIQKGDHFDVEVRTLSRSECTSLRDGWLMESRMREMALLGNAVHEGTMLALAEGPILVDPSAKEADKVGQCRGRVLGGGTSATSRELGLVLGNEERNVLTSAQVGTAINRRFHTYEGGIKIGVARPKTDEFIQLKVHPRYKDNIERYVRVIRALPVRETAAQQQARMQLLERQLLDPITAGPAALKLEALGKPAIDALRKGLDSKEDEVRFYAAEALAYLDESAAAEPLQQLARDVPAFRAFALAALGAMDDLEAYEALRDLLDAGSAETRYGAFRSLWAMNSRDPLVRGEQLNDEFGYHVLNTKSAPMVHVTRSYRPEIVLFGADQRFRTPLMIEAGKNIVITSAQNEHGDNQHVTVSRFVLDEPDQKRVVSSKVDDVIRAIVDLGGTYPDVVQALQHAKSTGALVSRFQVDAVPRGGRTYRRKNELTDPSESETPGEADSAPELVVLNPLPELFTNRGTADDKPASKAKASERERSKDEEKPRQKRRLLGTMLHRDDDS